MQEMKLQEFKNKKPTDLIAFAESLEVENASVMRKQELMFSILKKLAAQDIEIIGDGVVEVLQDGFGFMGGWLHAKIALVVLMSAVHGYLAGAVRKFAGDRNEKSARHWRIVNEVPTLLMIAIVILVIVKPF